MTVLGNLEIFFIILACLTFIVGIAVNLVLKRDVTRVVNLQKAKSLKQKKEEGNAAFKDGQLNVALLLYRFEFYREKRIFRSLTINYLTARLLRLILAIGSPTLNFTSTERPSPLGWAS